MPVFTASCNNAIFVFSISLVASAASVSADTYIYIKNTETANHLEVKTAGGTHFGRLRAGEAIFLCVKGGVGIEVQADTAAIVAEYATFTVG